MRSNCFFVSARSEARTHHERAIRSFPPPCNTGGFENNVYQSRGFVLIKLITGKIGEGMTFDVLPNSLVMQDAYLWFNHFLWARDNQFIVGVLDFDVNRYLSDELQNLGGLGGVW